METGVQVVRVGRRTLQPRMARAMGLWDEEAEIELSKHETGIVAATHTVQDSPEFSLLH